MKDFLQRIEKLSPKRLALLALEQHVQLEKLERGRREPIAIIGIGCRFPGDSNCPESFWEMLATGRDAITEIPADRFDIDALFDPDPSAPGKISVRWGGFVRDADRFDAPFFGISRREAVSMDPQQRFLLETSWEALEHAGVAPGTLAGSRMGIFFGLSTADYYQLLMQGGYEAIDGYTATGTAHSIAAGRLAYLLGVHGPNFVVDTACSSSLVALHLACQSLRAGECEMALAGGANLILSPETTIALSKARMLAPDGRCKTFDDSADGFVRSEGCGVIVLKTLSRALSDRDNVLAVIRGSAVNQDGRSSGLTAPNGVAQESVIREALESAGVQNSEVLYVEAHGTGTSLGDPIEAHALASVLGTGRSPQNPLYVGSVKSNIGHLEAAAGIAGIIKTVLSLQHETIPASLHFHKLNTHIDLKAAPVVVTAKSTPWPRGVRRIAGVSSFGFSGTNAHVILEEAPTLARAGKTPDSDYMLVVSARTEPALQALARRYADYLATHPDVSLGDFCHTAAAGRNRFEHTVTLSAHTVDQLRAKLGRVAEGNFASDGDCTSVKTSGDKIALPVYPFERQRYWVETHRLQASPERGKLGFYKLEWDKKPLAPAKSDASQSSGLSAGTIQSISEQVGPLFDPLCREHALDRYVELQPELDRATFEYIARALQSCGWNPVPGESVSAELLAGRLGIKSRYVRSLGRMLEIMGEEGVLERHGDSWKVLNSPTVVDPDPDFPLLHAAYPQFNGELSFLKRCGGKLADVLQGRLEPLNLLFPDGSFETAEDLYEKSAGAKVFQTLVQKAVGQALDRFPAGRLIRILEVGAGTGGTASYVARILPPDRCEYVFTDISPLFAERAAAKFRRYPFFRYEVLDIERDPESQGFAGQTFDIVIAANCIHATTDLRVSLRHIAKLLAPEGILLLLEGTRSERWVDASFGLTDGWWKFTDHDLRTDYPLVSRECWCGLLSELGFREVTALPEDLGSQQVLLMAQGTAAPSEKQPWLVISDSGRLAKPISNRLTELGVTSVTVTASDTTPPRDGGWRGIIDVAALDVPSAENLSDSEWADAQRFGCDRVRSLTKALAGNNSRLWVVTIGTQGVGGETQPTRIVAAPIWGMGRSVALEHPDAWGGLIDVDPSGDPDEQARLVVQEVIRSDGEDQVAFRQNERYVARLKSCTRPAATGIHLKADASYLITGGLGGLGLLVARWMAEQGARRLILVGRNGVTRPSQESTVREIERLGASVRVLRCDVANPEQMAGLFRTIAAEEPPLRGVIHAAAALSRDKVQEMSVETLREVLRPKVLGTWLLHRHTRDLNLDFLCLFASTASLLGSGGMAHYAAANQFLDAFAQYRRSLGLPASAIDWGTWEEMRTVSEEDRKQYRSLGLLPMPSSEALAVLGDLLQSEETSIMVAAVNWRTLRAVFEARRKRPLFEGIESLTPEQPVKPQPADTIEWEKFPVAERESRLTQVIWEETCRVLQIENCERVDLDRGFFEMGMDSLVSVELKSRLEARLGHPLPAMMTFNFPNVRALSKRLAAEFEAPQPPESVIATKTEPHSFDAGTLDVDEVARLLTEKLNKMQSLGGVLSTR